MPEVAVVADTCHYMPPELVERLGIGVVPLHVLLPDGTEKLENDYPDFSEFYEVLMSCADELPKTSQPSPGEFLAVWEPLLDEGREIVCLTISGGVSGTAASALQAREMLEGRAERVFIVDSKSGAGGEALVVLAASAAARAGKSGAAVAQHAEAARDKTRIWFAVDTLEYFERGGRIGRAQAWIGSALKIKPILTIEEEISPVERVRTSAKAFQRMVQYLELLASDGQNGWCVQHIRNPDQAAALVAEGRKIFGNEPLFVSEVGPVMGTYSGPGLLGVAGMPLSFAQI
jgi:DegV family protein with EDD domain